MGRDLKTASVLAALFSAALAACGGAHAVAPAPAVVALPKANPVAVGKMVQGVHAAKDGQRESAASFLREAIALDGNLWEARYDLGVVLAGGGDLAGAEHELQTAV
jgi:Flp pilus assembly protein TadD